jgi:pimeloyl-ACP methyl ester carboxylesterase
MATRINDMVFIFNGGFPFSQQFSVANDFDFAPYNNAKAKLNHTRTAISDSRGADNDINANVDTLMATIRGFVKDRLETIGHVVLLGRSNGCALALALAAELNDQGINDLTYVGVSDVPMWDSGRIPPVRKVGDFRPVNNPIRKGAFGPNPGIGGFLSVGPVPGGETPSYELPQEIKARNRVNLLQIQGNHMRYSNSLKRWIWFSDFSGGEVHGTLDKGFDNRLFKVKGSFFGSDLAFHVNLNTQQPWKSMTAEAAAKFAEFPPALL